MFNQSAPELGNQYDDDAVLRGYLAHALPAEVLLTVEDELREMGGLAGGPLYGFQRADRLNEPVHTPWDAWGHRIDHIEVTPLWRAAEPLAARSGLISIPYERKLGGWSRVHQFALAYLFTPSTDLYSCPLAMTDGAARTISQSGNDMLIERAMPHLTSRDPRQFWTSGQWMTESTGGSDVGLSATVARRGDDGQWRLYGRKWFTSAATGQMALTLARPEGNPAGGRGLALFYVEVRDGQGQLNNLSINRLKDKLGTRKVPTAELTLDGTIAVPVLGLSDGVKNIAPMLNVTRTWNSVSCVAYMRRALALVGDYAGRRFAFGSMLSEKPLHRDTLDGMQAEFEAAFHLTFYMVHLLGCTETGEANDSDQELLRVLTPVVKLTTAKQCVAVCSEALECFGGAGYVEDTGVPALLRDAQVFPIWEGTTNVLSLDALRVLHGGKSLDALSALMNDLARQVTHASLVEASQIALRVFSRARDQILHATPEDQERDARRIALAFGRALACALLCVHAQWRADGNQPGSAMSSASRFASTFTPIQA